MKNDKHKWRKEDIKGNLNGNYIDKLSYDRHTRGAFEKLLQLQQNHDLRYESSFIWFHRTVQINVKWCDSQISDTKLRSIMKATTNLKETQ